MNSVIPKRNSYILFAVLMPIVLLVLSWLAVAWHRFVILDKRVGILPSWKTGIILGYVRTIVALTLVSFFIGFVIGFFGGFGSRMFPQFEIPISVVQILLLTIVPAVFQLRFGLTLPAIAVGRPLRLVESWNATRGYTTSLFMIVIIYLMVFLLMGFIFSGFHLPLRPLCLLEKFAMTWVFAMLGLSTLTTLYGHIVEGRDLP